MLTAIGNEYVAVSRVKNPTWKFSTSKAGVPSGDPLLFIMDLGTQLIA
jgi:hypothetical protein